jgi:alpha-tubulin suppressor-like RCC1 family protein
MGSRSTLRWLLPVALAAGGCSRLLGYDELDRVDCVDDCGTGGGAGAGGGAAGTSGGTGIQRLGIGRNTSCAVLADGKLRCWGQNTGNPSTPVSPKPVEVPGVDTPDFISAGLAHACVTQLGEAWCWGKNDKGQLGDGTQQDRSIPTKAAVPGTVERVLSAFEHTCALVAVTDADGGVAKKQYCWGSNEHGQLGQSGIPLSSTPVEVALGADVAMASASGNHSCAAVLGLGVWCWGDNSTGQLGQDPATTPKTSTPTKVPSVADTANKVYLGDTSTCTRDNYISSCWGSNEFGQLGDGKLQPVRFDAQVIVGLGEVGFLNVGARHACAADRTTNAIYCWGANDSGQLGTKTPHPTTVPSLVPGEIPTQFATKGEHACAVLGTSKMVCWGLNDVGQIGNGQVGGSVKDPTEVVF